ncbi:helix-turn-helix domain-containing protein [Actinoplanes sp. RD1]|uniref:helix-turn-helix domain-containing protein n=1 Tax=Actinoplanes sp. RD1 TaxID=3064538 RepID=UPI002741C15F|nr:helix-turn-helix domain-containing protein [Actinoplanes sp. RD1]
MTGRNWREVRAEANLDRDRVAAHEQRMLAEVRAARLAEMRRQLDMTQTQVAERMHVSQARVSAIENGDVDAAELGTLKNYIAALGGRLEVVATFGDQSLRLG